MPEKESSQAGYKYLITYMLSTVIYDLTVEFYSRFLPSREHLRLREQAIHAARSGRQNIAEGYCEVSLRGYIKLAGVAKASLEELKLDYEDFLRQRNLPLFAKDDPRIGEIRGFRVKWVDEINLNTPNLPNDPTLATNSLITLISLNTYLLAKLISALEKKFVDEGGYTEKLFKKRLRYRKLTQ